jgi:hypothetical protein
MAAENKSGTKLFAKRNRGLLVDISILLANLFAMRFLVMLFVDVFRRASAGDMIARFGILLFYAAMLILPSVAAVLKRWHYHQRLIQRGEKEEGTGWLPFGCIFLPPAYLIVNMWISLAVSLTWLDLSSNSELGGTISGFLLGIGLIYNIFQTVLVFRYFAPQKHPPRSAFFRDRRSDIIGDICIFINMLFSQMLLSWGAVSYPGFHEGRFVDRFVPLLVFALLMYLTGRIFFLVEDIRRPRTWVTILVVNIVIALRVVLF